MKQVIYIIMNMLSLNAFPAMGQTALFPKGDPLSTDYFTDPAFLYPLLTKDKNNEFALGSVTFEPGARTIWHTHPKGQVLIATEGDGFYQERGKPARHLKKGDVVNIPENVEHWHGATAHSKFVHIAITNYKGDQNVVWLKPVSEEEYRQANSSVLAADESKTLQHLSVKQQSIVSISALTAVGNIEGLKIALNSGLDSGLTINEIKDVLVQLYAYCGFPRSLNGINTFMAVLEERKVKGIQDTEGKSARPVHDADKYQTGKKTLQALTGREEKTPSGANAFAPAIDTFLKEHLFADIFSRDVLDHQQRELVTISTLAAMSGVAAQLQAHIGIAMHIGLTGHKLQDVFAVIDSIIGKKEGDLARSTLDKVANERSRN